MARAALTPSRQLAVGAATVAAALATVVAGVWQSTAGAPRLDRPTASRHINVVPAAVLDARANLANAAVSTATPLPSFPALPTAGQPAEPAIVTAPPGGGPAAQPPAQPPPPSPPPGTEPEDPVEQVIETVEDTLVQLEAISTGIQ